MLLFPFQFEIYNKIKDKNSVLISSPTGSGKTLIAYMWSGIYNPKTQKYEDLKQNRIIFTAPIKALSNERFFDLKKKGLDVGLETGDIKNNTNANILCCTQEIYTRKYAKVPNQRVIIDELHYIFTNPDRSRAYIDGIINTSSESSILCMSATFGNSSLMQNYLKNISNRDFFLVENKQRLTSLEYKGIINPVDVRDSLVFVFSYKGVIGVAEILANFRSFISSEKMEALEELAKEQKVEILPLYKKGIGIYHGSMLPKEKIFIEKAFRKRLLDVVVGTDALALGVNLPAQKVVFAQLAKYYEGCITKNEFLQMAGRAGRYGFFSTGEVYYMQTPYESMCYNTKVLFDHLVKAEQEEPFIYLTPNLKEIIQNKVTPEEEADFVAKNSLPPLDKDDVLENIRSTLDYIDCFIKDSYKCPKTREKFLDVLKDIYHQEIDIVSNLTIAKLYTNNEINTDNFVNVIVRNERNLFYGLLKARKVLKTYDNKYSSKIDINRIDDAINNIDETVLALDDSYSNKKNLSTVTKFEKTYF